MEYLGGKGHCLCMSVHSALAPGKSRHVNIAKDNVINHTC